MFLWRNKKNINTFGLKKATYQELLQMCRLIRIFAGHICSSRYYCPFTGPLHSCSRANPFRSGRKDRHGHQTNINYFLCKSCRLFTGCNTWRCFVQLLRQATANVLYSPHCFYSNSCRAMVFDLNFYGNPRSSPRS